MCYDIVFKSVFIGEENILAKMVSDITGIDYRVLENNIILEVNELPINTRKEKAKRCDFILRIDKNNILNLELNGNYYPGMVVKNLSYLCKLFSSETKRGEEYNENLLATQINLNCYEDNADKSLARYLLQEVDNHYIYSKNISIFAVNVVKCNELYYTLSKEKKNIPNYIRWGALLYNRDFNNIPEIAEGIMTDKERERIMDKIDKLTKDNLFMSELEAREWAEWEEKSKLTYATSKGKEEATKEIILSMIENKIPIEMISKITNKTIEDIEGITKEN